jgi:hypothetical protein
MERVFNQLTSNILLIYSWYIHEFETSIQMQLDERE